MILLASLINLCTAESFPCLKMILTIRFLCREHLQGEEAQFHGTNFFHHPKDCLRIRNHRLQGVGDKGLRCSSPFNQLCNTRQVIFLFPFIFFTFIKQKYTVTALQGIIYEHKFSKRCEMNKPAGSRGSQQLSFLDDCVHTPPKVLCDNQNVKQHPSSQQYNGTLVYKLNLLYNLKEDGCICVCVRVMAMFIT